MFSTLPGFFIVLITFYYVNITFLCMILIGVVFDCTYYTMYDIYIVYLLTDPAPPHTCPPPLISC